MKKKMLCLFGPESSKKKILLRHTSLFTTLMSVRSDTMEIHIGMTSASGALKVCFSVIRKHFFWSFRIGVLYELAGFMHKQVKLKLKQESLRINLLRDTFADANGDVFWIKFGEEPSLIWYN